ncbi:Osmotically-inducible protein OsmY OS=Eoetvoesiella caeni OX=645616 GN=DFR37_107142 PE=4 SV=1 [Eoetvoesiella caeni]
MNTPQQVSRALLLALGLTCTAVLTGCGALVVGGAAAGTAIVATDRRTAGEQVEDKSIEMKVGSETRRLFAANPDSARVVASSYAGHVLLVGDVPTQADKDKAGTAAKGVEKVKQVVNELRVGEVTPLSVRTNDTWLTTKVTTALINTKDVPSRTIVVTTERGIVYLQGKVTDTEGQLAAKAAASVSGVNKVVKLFEIVSRESTFMSQPPAPVENKDSSSAPPASSAGSGSGAVETIPIQ